MHNQTYDYILPGAGLAGLTLALELARRPAFRERRILLLDRDDKNRNDRTWCFWATDNETLPPVTFRAWNRCLFFGENFQATLDFAPYRYRMVRGIDFYEWAKKELASCPNVHRQTADIQNIDAETGRIKTSAGDFEGQWIFNSAFVPPAVAPPDSPLFKTPFTTDPLAKQKTGNAIFLLQHFKGWVIETPVPAFDPETPTFMDFRVAQHGETRFVYVLPFSTTRALVEFTVFSPALLPPDTYTAELRDYLKKYLNINDFHIEEEEFGIIPMTDSAFPTRPDGRVIHIGTAGGFVKGSSGYAFKRTQRRIRAFVDAWEKTGAPDPAIFQSPRRFRALDSIFLRVLADRGELGRQVFTNLFQKLPSAVVLRFLDEDATFAELLRVVSAPPTWPFLRAAWRQLPHLWRF